jgi:decaprenylphospho-beta-D-erythro-pentofuranosid-2-ulose 2-reductase
VNNAVAQPQTIVVLGGTSDIGQAIVAELASPVLRSVVLAVRRPEDIDVDVLTATLQLGGAEVVVVPFDATAPQSHAGVVADIVERVGDLDVVIQAFGQLGAPGLADPVDAAALAQVNYVGAVSSGLAVADQLRRQGHGTLVVLSSVAGFRTRASNFVYGSTKAGQDGFATGLGHSLVGSGARVMTVRPGFVRSSMTEGMAEAPFSTDPADVAAAVAAGLRRKRSVVWVPGILRVVMGLLRFAPDAVWRRLDR